MKAKMLNFKVWSFMFLTLVLGVFFLALTPQKNSASAENFTPVTISDSSFSMQMSAAARKSSQALNLDKRKVSANIGGQQIDYDFYCFQWRDINYLRFRFNSNISESKSVFSMCEFKLTYVETDVLSASFGNGQEKSLYQTSILSNTFNSFDFYYHIDKDAEINESKERTKGFGFGLYKFDFCYTYSDEENSNVKRSIGEFYVAILPDDIDSIQKTSMQILYSVSSSKKLMNVYNLYLSKDTYKYVNPRYLEWIVVGVDKEKTSYVYSEKLRNEYIAYANYKSIWTMPPYEPYGTSFTFDSNNIEGVWTAYCVIKDKAGNETTRLAVDNLSTIKKSEQSNIWLILTIVFSVLLLGGIVGLVVFYVKRDKIW